MKFPQAGSSGGATTVCLSLCPCKSKQCLFEGGVDSAVQWNFETERAIAIGLCVNFVNKGPEQLECADSHTATQGGGPKKIGKLNWLEMVLVVFGDGGHSETQEMNYPEWFVWVDTHIETWWREFKTQLSDWNWQGRVQTQQREIIAAGRMTLNEGTLRLIVPLPWKLCLVLLVETANNKLMISEIKCWPLHSLGTQSAV